MADDSSTAGHPPAGQGRLAQLIATRGGKASPEAPFVIEHRAALIYMLCEAAELEHGIMCQYLYAAFSLKQGEGLAGDQLAAVQRWRSRIAHVATQEMLHLALVHNLSAIGAAPHLTRPNLPQPANYYPAGVQLTLLPFGEQALRHFMFLERPEGMDLADADGLRAVGQAQPHLSERDIVPRGQDFVTVGHLYRSIEAGLAHLAGQHGEDWLFVGPPRAQATPAHFGWPELIPVTDLASAQRAIDEILEQGEGPRGHWQNAHFGQFVEILDEYQQMVAASPDFDPVRPVVAANVRPHERDTGVRLITDPLTARVADLFNVGYEILLQALERFFAHTEESDAQLKTLAVRQPPAAVLRGLHSVRHLHHCRLPARRQRQRVAGRGDLPGRVRGHVDQLHAAVLVGHPARAPPDRAHPRTGPPGHDPVRHRQPGLHRRHRHRVRQRTGLAGPQRAGGRVLHLRADADPRAAPADHSGRRQGGCRQRDPARTGQ
jgi:hypothetical protein